MNRKFIKFFEDIGVSYNNINLYSAALTHISYINEHPDAKNDYDYDVMYDGTISMLAHTSSKISRMKPHILSSIIDARSNVLDYTSELKIARRTHHTM